MGLHKQPTSIVIEREITRADGSKRPGDENKVVAFYHRNALRRLLYWLRGGRGRVKLA